MAAAARPGPTDARVPCPLCGGLIHPIAGKCKHCKAELGSFHAPRAAASAPLPPLRGGPAAAPGQVHWIGKPQAAGELAPTASTPQARRDPSEPVLPPRPTVRGAAAEPAASSWRSWPVVVIVLAMLAIIAAVVLMVLPAGRDEDRGKRSTASPAPDRMQTAPDITPPQPPHAAPGKPAPAPQAPPSQDPWADPPAGSGSDANPGADPSASGSSADSAARDPDSDDLGLVNPLDPAPPARSGGRHRLNLNANATMMMTMAAHLCRKLAQCGSADPTTAQICSALSAQAPPLPTNCPAASRCMKAIDGMSCAGQIDDLSQIPSLFKQFADCGAAAQC
ncbi:MAG TPA: hypothetical protein VGC42_20075 [Kofleriaceae bacterium]